MGSCESTTKNSEERKRGENIEQLNIGRLSSEEEELIKKVAIGAGVALLGWGLCKLIDNGGYKMMKAPGRRNRYIYREEFEHNPSEYFRRLLDE